MSHTQFAYILAALFGAAFLFLIARGWWRAKRASWRAKSRARVAQSGEEHAEHLLEQAGYTIIDRQVSFTWQIHCDGEPVDIPLRADLIVERDNQTFVAEVKTGEHAPLLRNAATRRQLLEYLVAYHAEGVLLIDIPNETVQQIDFGLATDRRWSRNSSHGE